MQQIFKAIVEINRTEGLTILLVEQNAYQALKIAHRGYVLATGRMLMSGHRPRASGQPRDPRRLSRGRALSMQDCRLLGTSPAIFIGLTLILIGGAAILTGRAVARELEAGAGRWCAACFGLALADRFLTYALFQGELLNSWG